MRRKRRRQTPQHWTPRRIAVKNLKAPAHLNSPRDERLVALEVGLLQGAVSVVAATVPLASLRVHHPQTLHRVRASLREEPSLHAAIVQRVLAGAMVWHVYRDESGALVMYDDYAAYLVAQELGRQMMYEMVRDPVNDQELLKQVSPVFHAAKIKAPLLVAQGANDPRVKKAESDQIVQALRQRGVDVDYIVKDNEGHGFRNEENRFEFYEAMERFLGKHLQP